MKNDLKVMKQREKQKVLSSFFTNIKLSKITFIIVFIAGLINILLYYNAYLDWNNNRSESDSLLNAVIGYYCLCICFAQDSYMSAVKKFRLRKRNANKILDGYSDKKAYETISILPVKKKELIIMDIKVLSSIFVLLFVSLIGANIIYLINTDLKDSAGYFVIITLSSIAISVGDFFVKYYFKRIGFIMEWSGIAVYCLLVVVNLIMNSSDKVNRIVNSFLGINVFRLFAGIPMIVLCFLVIPLLYLIYKKTDFKNGKMAVWNC